MEAIRFQVNAQKCPARRFAEADKPNQGPARKRLNSRPTCRSCHRSLKIWDFAPTDLAGRANKPLMIVAIARRCFGPMSSLVSLVSWCQGRFAPVSASKRRNNKRTCHRINQAWGMTEHRDSVASEREEIAARVARFKAM